VPDHRHFLQIFFLIASDQHFILRPLRLILCIIAWIAVFFNIEITVLLPAVPISHKTRLGLPNLLEYGMMKKH
ncbi:MAG: hypothetical protein IIV82_02820, partial [Ruminococcus sp.]|nr:hypothetical protein [Ruminococcus sp.]